AGRRPSAFAAGRFHGASSPLDFAVADAGSRNVGVVVGQSAGAFAARNTYEVNGAPQSLALADVDGDHFPDFALGGIDAGTGILSLLLNDKHGVFPKVASHLGNGGRGPVSVVIGRFDMKSATPGFAAADAT